MTYSCSDLADDVMEALGVTVPPKYADRPDKQADLCLKAITRLKSEARVAQSQRDRLADAISEINCADGDYYTDAPECARGVTALCKAIGNASALAEKIAPKKPAVPDDGKAEPTPPTD